MLKLNMNWQKMTPAKSNKRQIDYDKLRIPAKRREYQETIDKKVKIYEEEEPQKQLDNIASACKEASLEILGHKEKSKKYDSDDIKNLSEQQKQIRQDINATIVTRENHSLEARTITYCLVVVFTR